MILWIVLYDELVLYDEKEKKINTLSYIVEL